MGERTLGFPPFSPSQVPPWQHSFPRSFLSFFSDYNDNHSKVLVLRDVTEAFATLAQRSIILCFEKEVCCVVPPRRNLAMMPESLREGRRVSSFASDPGWGWGCPERGAGRTCWGSPQWRSVGPGGQCWSGRSLGLGRTWGPGLATQESSGFFHMQLWHYFGFSVFAFIFSNLLGQVSTHSYFKFYLEDFRNTMMHW